MAGVGLVGVVGQAAGRYPLMNPAQVVCGSIDWPVPIADLQSRCPPVYRESSVQTHSRHPQADVAWIGDVTYIPTGEGW